jgi:hypothetical protein
MTITLLDYANGELQAATKEATRAHADLTAAQQDLSGGETALAAALAQLAQLQDEATKIRQQIAVTTIVADGEALFADLEENTVETRSTQAEVVDAEDTIADARSRIAGAADELERTASAQKAAQDAKDAAEKRDADHTTWSTAAGASPLKDIPSKADVTAAGDAKTAEAAAKARLTGANGDIPKELFDLARARRAARAARLEKLRQAALDAEDALTTELAKDGLGGTSAQAKVSFARSETALKEFALTGEERYERALTLLAGVGASTALNADEKKRIADLKTAGVAAIPKQEARDLARKDLDDAFDELAAAFVKVIGKDPTVDPETQTDVQTARGKITTARQTLTQKQTDYDAVKKDLELWEAAVPDATWNQLRDYEEALDLLAQLKGTVVATLVSDLGKAEEDYAKALTAERDNARKVVALDNLSRERSDRWANVARTRPTRLLGALRGDE